MTRRNLAPLGALCIALSALIFVGVLATRGEAEPVPGRPGTSGLIEGTSIAASSISTSHIVDSTITTSDVAANTLTAADLAADSVEASEISADAVGTSEIATDGVGSAEIAAGAVGTSELATNGVASVDIADDAVGFADIDYSNVIGSHPALGAGECFFEDTGFVCEGATEDNIELLLTFSDPASTDKTITFPATTGTVLLSTAATAADTFSCTGACTLDAGGAAGITIGSADVTALTVTTDSTGTAEVALPAGSIDGTEILDGTLTAPDVNGLADTASTLRARVPLVFTLAYAAADFVANDDIVLTVPAGHNILVIDAYNQCVTAEGGAFTVQLFTAANGGGTAITSAFDANATTVARTTAGTFAGGAIAASGSIYVHGSTNPGTVATCHLVIVYVHTT